MSDVSRGTFTPFAHQERFADLWGAKRTVLNLDGCGTGKSLACIHAIKTHWPEARVLVLAPLSILKSAWANDLDFGWPEASKAIALANDRAKQFAAKAQWTITTHAAATQIVKNDWHHDFDVLIVDEADAFRNRTTLRSKALATIAQSVPVRTLMTGTPTPNSVVDIWHLAYCVDGGERLGRNYFGFRSSVCTPRPVPGVNAMNYVDKPGAADLVAALLSDITTRVSLNDVQELPDTIYREVTLDMPPRLKTKYDQMRRDALVALDDGSVVSAVHAGAKVQKLLQICAGGIYDELGGIHDLHPARSELAIELAGETDAALVAFHWKHQRDSLIRECEKHDLSYAVIDGEVPATARDEIVRRFQAGELRVLLAHPQSAGHGLTFTRANRVIWASPTWRPDLYEQLNHRIIRTGQRRKTEILHIANAGSAELQVYRRMREKKGRMHDLLDLMVALNEAA